MPDTSTVAAPAGTSTLPRRPTATMRLSRTTTTPSSITSSPRIVTMRAPVSAQLARGLSASALKPIFCPCSGGFGSSAGAPATKEKLSSSLAVNSSSPSA